MSITFSICGSEVDWEGGSNCLNVANANGRDLLQWLGLPCEELVGSVPAAELAARCRRRLWDEARNRDPEVPTTDSWSGRLTVIDSDGSERVVGGEPGLRVIYCGRPADYLRSQTERRLALAQLAGAEPIEWA